MRSKKTRHLRSGVQRNFCFEVREKFRQTCINKNVNLSHAKKESTQLLKEDVVLQPV